MGFLVEGFWMEDPGAEHGGGGSLGKLVLRRSGSNIGDPNSVP